MQRIYRRQKKFYLHNRISRIFKTILTDKIIIKQTVSWIKKVVVECNFCPFAAKALLKKSIRYAVLPSANLKNSLATFYNELKFLDGKADLETTFIIIPNNFKNFNSYLSLVEKVEELISKENYTGIYQVASFHPKYCFDGSTNSDAANYTNRSPYPMLHILREESITKALSAFPHPEKIPERNINYAREKGLKYMQLLRVACLY